MLASRLATYSVCSNGPSALSVSHTTVALFRQRLKNFLVARDYNDCSADRQPRKLRVTSSELFSFITLFLVFSLLVF